VKGFDLSATVWIFSVSGNANHVCATSAPLVAAAEEEEDDDDDEGEAEDVIECDDCCFPVIDFVEVVVVVEEEEGRDVDDVDDDEEEEEEEGGVQSLQSFTSAAGSLADVINMVPSGEKRTLPTPEFE
jgi:hypothetical protein